MQRQYKKVKRGSPAIYFNHLFPWNLATVTCVAIKYTHVWNQIMGTFRIFGLLSNIYRGEVLGIYTPHIIVMAIGCNVFEVDTERETHHLYDNKMHYKFHKKTRLISKKHKLQWCIFPQNTEQPMPFRQSGGIWTYLLVHQHQVSVLGCSKLITNLSIGSNEKMTSHLVRSGWLQSKLVASSCKGGSKESHLIRQTLLL